MKTRVGIAVFAVVLFAAFVASAQSSRWPFAENTFQPNFVSDIAVVAHMEPKRAGHGASYEPRYVRVRVLRTKSGAGCWIGNDTEPHNWAPAPPDVCR